MTMSRMRSSACQTVIHKSHNNNNRDAYKEERERMNDIRV